MHFYLEEENYEDYLHEWVDMKVLSDFYEDGAEEINIIDYKLMDFNLTFIDIFIEFENPGLLSLSLLEPEVLNINITRSLVAQDFSRLSNRTSLYTDIPEQFTVKQIEELRRF